MAKTILRTFSACCFSLERVLIWAIFVRPSTRPCNFVAEIFADGIEIDERVFYDVVQQAGGNAHLIEPHIGQNLRNF